MTVREYIGARYVPLFMGDWDNTNTYEPLSIVLYQGNSYTSRQYVPTGIEISNDEYWAETGNFNAQVEQYRQEVLTFDERITENADDIIETNEKIDELVEKNLPSTITQENQKAFPNYAVKSPSDVEKASSTIVRVNEDLSLSSAIASGMMQTFNVNGNSDYCEAISLVGSYLAHASEFIYNNGYTGTTFEGTYDNPTQIDPKQHLTNGKMHIDCATFTTLIGNGTSFDYSVYAPNRTSNIAMHNMFNPKGGATKPYWKYGINRATTPSDVGYGRVLTDAQAKMFYDGGVLSEIGSPLEMAQIGDILFSGSDTSRFLNITHCAVVCGMVGFSTQGMIIAESVSSTDDAIVSRKYADSALTLRAKISPNYNAGLRLHRYYAPYILMVNNRNLSTNPLTFDANTGRYDVLAKVIAITSNTLSQRTIHVNATNGISTIDQNATFFGTTLIYLPYGWSITLSSEETDTFNIALQKCGTDKAIIIPPKS